jgi:hypothetical protein
MFLFLKIIRPVSPPHVSVEVARSGLKVGNGVVATKSDFANQYLRQTNLNRCQIEEATPL